MEKQLKRKPRYLQFKIPAGKKYKEIKQTLQEEGLHTICTEAKCPNIGECFCSGTATFLIMGNNCTRNCHYCAVPNTIPEPLDPLEPLKIARVIVKLHINYAVITSVTRDDLPDGGAGHFAQTVKEIRSASPECKIELLVPDFASSYQQSLNKIIAVQPNVINHNIETTRNMFTILRPQGNYELSLRVIKQVSGSHVTSKSGLMIGFGEDIADIRHTLNDLKDNGCDALTIGQYLQATKNGFPVQRYYSEEEFAEIERIAYDIGFKHISCGPLVRSSYRAAQIISGQ